MFSAFMAGRHVRDLAAAVAAGVLLGTAASSLTAPERAAGHATGAAETVAVTVDAESVGARLAEAVVRADVEACGLQRQGTVTMVEGDDGVEGLTNAHVVQGANRVALSGAGLGVSEGSVQEYLKGRDAAVVDLGRFGNEVRFPLERGPAPVVGQLVVIAGFPGGAWTVSTGSVHSIERRSGWSGTTDVLLVDVPAEQGVSGGVVADSQGRAVGLIAARDPRTGWAVAYPIDDIVQRPEGPVPSC